MAGIFIKEDLRRIKTQKSVQNAFEFLLQHRSFKNITVNELCAEAFISRSAFYANYKDKYDLLDAHLNSLIIEPFDVDNILQVAIYDNYKKICNILYEVDNETMQIVYKFSNNCLELLCENYGLKMDKDEYTIFSNFCIGGVINHIIWQVNSKKEPDSKRTKEYFMVLINKLLEWSNEQNAKKRQ